jgi:hypothetical protein
MFGIINLSITALGSGFFRGIVKEIGHSPIFCFYNKGKPAKYVG